MTTQQDLKSTNKKIQYNTSAINDSILNNIDSILKHFNVDYYKYGNKITTSCPIHGGDNTSAFSILLEGSGNWMCYTHQCHEQYGGPNGATLIKLIEALLNKSGKKYNFHDTIKWITNFNNLSNSDVVDSQLNLLQREFIHLTKHLSNKETATNDFVPKELVSKKLDIPSQYFIKRGFDPATLHHFMVGECLDSTKPMFQRAVAPFFDDSGKYIVGCSGRSIFDKCSSCSLYHNPNNRCPITKQEKMLYSKWKHSGGFNAESYLYNLHNVKNYLGKTVIITESPGNVWKMFEAGITNTLATLGTSFRDGQKGVLECLGVMNIILAKDNGKAGDIMAESMKKQCYRIFNFHVVETPYDDMGETPIELIQELFRGIYD
jgi:hypothetical protein